VAAGGRGGANAPAATDTVAPQKAKLKPAQPQADMFEVEADKVDIYKNSGEAFFQGNVKLPARI